MKKIFLTALLITQVMFANAESIRITSPDGNVKATFEVVDGVMQWSVDHENESVILPSKLGIMGYNSGMKVLDVSSVAEKDTTWHPVYGERSSVRDHYNTREIILQKGDNQGALKMAVEFRAYNEGVAFRYKFLQHPNGGPYIHITKEDTEFSLPEQSKAWVTSHAQGSYSLKGLDNWGFESERPLTIELPNGKFAALGEAQMVNFSRMKFVLSKENTIGCSLYGEVDDIAPFACPWRFVMVANQPGELLENNDLVLNLNPPCEIDQTWWIKPGKVMRETSLSMEGAKRLVDFAVKRNIQYIHFDAGWYGYENDANEDATTVTVDPRRNPSSDLDLKAAIDYAHKNGVGVFVYVNQRALDKQLDELLPLYRDWGVAGIKFGFVQVGSHRWTTWLHDAVQKCAEYGLMVNIHDEYRPTGFSRTYPNLMTQEGVRGNEEMPDATLNTILPFTRYVAGAADYTICYYYRKEMLEAKGFKHNGRYVRNTPAHQLALSMINYSPLQWMYWYDKPEDSQDEPELAFFDALPTVWDDSKVLSGRPGESVVMARKQGDRWFVGGITNTEARKLDVDFSFLDPEKQYCAEIYTDGGKAIKTRTQVKVSSRKNMKQGDQLAFDVLPSGGFTMILTPIND